MTPLLQVDGLTVHYRVRGGLDGDTGLVVRAVDGVDLRLGQGETLAIVGESGCGKTSIARALLGLAPIAQGAIAIESGGRLERAVLDSLAYRRQVQLVFQDPFESLNPRKSVYQTLAQPLRIHSIVPGGELRAEAARLLDSVGLSPGEQYLDRFPHQFSGGQRQRICIARAIAVRPRVVVADEPVSALDVSIRAQILALFRTLSRDLSLSTIFISHDLSVVRSLSDRIVVMYLGRIVEEGDTEAVFAHPRHPYTAALIAASPIADPVRARSTRRVPLAGDVPSPTRPPPACRFHPRCVHARPECGRVDPALTVVGPGRSVACHFALDDTGRSIG